MINIYCSFKVKEKEHSDEPKEKICSVCNDIFIPKNKDEEWCSYSCASGN